MPSFKRISVSVHRRRSRWDRPLVKALTYRGWMATLDILVVYLITGRIGLALGFSLLSLFYRTVGRSIFERLWSHVAPNSAL
jgi:uncharacterized membrane protein